jgi:hypothetical protein
MPKKFKLYLSGGKTKVVTAKTPKEARDKYYGSEEHFRTERAVLKIGKYKRTMPRKKSLMDKLLPF